MNSITSMSEFDIESFAELPGAAALLLEVNTVLQQANQAEWLTSLYAFAEVAKIELPSASRLTQWQLLAGSEATAASAAGELEAHLRTTRSMDLPHSMVLMDAYTSLHRWDDVFRTWSELIKPELRQLQATGGCPAPAPGTVPSSRQWDAVWNSLAHVKVQDSDILDAIQYVTALVPASLMQKRKPLSAVSTAHIVRMLNVLLRVL